MERNYRFDGRAVDKANLAHAQVCFLVEQLVKCQIFKRYVCDIRLLLDREAEGGFRVQHPCGHGVCADLQLRFVFAAEIKLQRIAIEIEAYVKDTVLIAVGCAIGNGKRKFRLQFIGALDDFAVLDGEIGHKRLSRFQRDVQVIRYECHIAAPHFHVNPVFLVTGGFRKTNISVVLRGIRGKVIKGFRKFLLAQIRLPCGRAAYHG